MIYKNTLKIMISNFDIVWKSIIYYLFVFGITGALCYLCLHPIYRILEQSGFIENIANVYSNFLTNLNLTELLEKADDLVWQFASILKHNLSIVWINFAGLGLTIVFLRAFLSNLTIMASCNSLHYYMGSMNKHGFYVSFRETLGSNLKAQLMYFVVSLPLKILFYFLCFMCLKLFGVSFWLTLVAIILFLTLVVCFCALKHCLLDGWVPTMVVMNYGVIKALRTSVKNSFRIFPRVFAGAIGVVITLMISNFFIGIFTFSAGLVITVPFSYLLVSVYGMVITYEGQGMRYYIDVYNVITPKKKEIGDKLSDMKYIV